MGGPEGSFSSFFPAPWGLPKRSAKPTKLTQEPHRNQAKKAKTWAEHAGKERVKALEESGGVEEDVRDCGVCWISSFCPCPPRLCPHCCLLGLDNALRVCPGVFLCHANLVELAQVRRGAHARAAGCTPKITR